MITASDQYVQAMKNPIGEFHIKLEIYDSQYQYIKELTKQVTKNDIGNISVDMTRPVRRSFSFSLDNTDGEYTWGDSGNLIWIDKRVKLYTGLRLSDGTIGYVPQGVFILSAPQDTHDLKGKITSITGLDKMSLATDKRGKFLNELKIATGTNIATAIRTIAAKIGETQFNFDTVTETVPYGLTYQPSDNIYNAFQELAILAKCQIYYDENGYLRLRKIDLNQISSYPPVWGFKYGDPTELFYAGNVRKMDETNLANHIIVLGGSGQTAVARYELKVTTADPLWVNSAYAVEKIGDILYFHNNASPDPLLSTVDECKWRAKYELMRRLGYTERLSMPIYPLWLLDAGDVIQVTDAENSVDGRYLIESLNIPLQVQSMTVDCRKERDLLTDWNFI